MLQLLVLSWYSRTAFRRSKFGKYRRLYRMQNCEETDNSITWFHWLVENLWYVHRSAFTVHAVGRGNSLWTRQAEATSCASGRQRQLVVLLVHAVRRGNSLCTLWEEATRFARQPIRWPPVFGVNECVIIAIIRIFFTN